VPCWWSAVGVFSTETDNHLARGHLPPLAALPECCPGLRLRCSGCDVSRWSATVRTRQHAQRGYLDVEALAGELLAPGSVFAFLAKHRERLFPDSIMEDLFPSLRGRPVGSGAGDWFGSGATGIAGAIGPGNSRGVDL
jgi:hypothetical protein